MAELKKPALELMDAERIQKLNAFYAELQVLTGAEDATQERYGAAAEASEAALCCPIEYDAESTSHIPQGILDIDYGCGDPTVFAEAGQRVLDLGSGSGKHAFMIAKKVGPQGYVIGVDKTPQMLKKSRAAIPAVMKNLGFSRANVDFRCGHIENLMVDKERLDEALDGTLPDNYEALEQLADRLNAEPLIPDASIDLVVSNCVLNLVDDARKQQLMREIFRVVKMGGSVAISDIVADRPIPQALKEDPRLWSGCLSGAFQRDEFHAAFARAGFYGMEEAKSYFWQRVDDINFYSVTIRAYKGKQGPCYETYRSALYEGPFSSVQDDDGHTYQRGEWTRVCEKTAELLSKPPYQGRFQVTPALEDPAKKIPFDCSPAADQKGLANELDQRLNELLDAGECCGPEGCC